uniref:TMEM205-like domain-containing protein n=1 Tax=Cucumis melo TaxID=3656 RepID=A0A9I9DQN0_CUCME
MTNLFAMFLIITTLTAAGLWSPPPPPQNVIVKEGHRVVVVEYDDQGQHNTKVSISSEPDLDAKNSERHRTKDLICDVYGKCKHKVASAVEKAKVMVTETAQEAHDVGESVAGAFDEAKDKLKEGAKETFGEAKDKLKEGAKGAKETFGEAKDKLKEGAKETLEMAKSREEKVVKGAERVAKETGEKIQTGENKLKENLMGLVDRGFKVMNYLFRHLGVGMDALGLLGFAMALGMGVWVTFISSYVLASVLPRQQLGVVQSKIYPVYFKAMASCIGMALLGHLFSRTEWKFPIPKNSEVVQGYVLVAALLMIFANSLYMEPRATKVMFERLKIEKEEGRGIEDIGREETVNVIDNSPAITSSTPTQIVDREVVKSRIVGLNKRLKKLNSYSSLLNLLTLMALTWHLVYLSQRLCNPC